MVAMLLGGDVSYAYDSSVNTPVPKSEQSEQYIPPPSLPPQVSVCVGEAVEIQYPMIGSMVWECEDPPMGVEQELSYIVGADIILCIKGLQEGKYLVNMIWHNPLDPSQPPKARQTIKVIVQPCCDK